MIEHDQFISRKAIQLLLDKEELKLFDSSRLVKKNEKVSCHLGRSILDGYKIMMMTY